MFELLRTAFLWRHFLARNYFIVPGWKRSPIYLLYLKTSLFGHIPLFGLLCQPITETSIKIRTLYSPTYEQSFCNFKYFSYICAILDGIVHWEDFLRKVLLKLSSTLKLRNFDIGMKMIAVAPHLRFVQPMLASYISFGVGYCFIRVKGNARSLTKG